MNLDPNNPMKERDKNEQLIDKLIKKRKRENDAFLKLLNAIESKTNTSESKANGKSKKH